MNIPESRYIHENVQQYLTDACFDARLNESSCFQSKLHGISTRMVCLARLGCLILAAGFSGSYVLAANVPNFDQAVDFNVREQNINEFLVALFDEIDVPVQINSELEGNVNGKFKESARNVFDEVSNAFSLVVYYDGAVAQAYRKNEVSRKLLAVTPSESKRVLSIAQYMKLPDQLNAIDIADSGVLVTGTDRFISQIDEIITSVKSSPKKKPVARKTPVPLVEVEAGVSFPKESPVVYQLFKLKHAWANDTRFPVGGQTIVIPGIATILNELIQKDSGKKSWQPAGRTNTLSGLRGQGLNKSREINGKNIDLNIDLSESLYSNDGADTLSNAQSDEVPRIVADSRLNAVIIRDKEDKMPAYRRLIDSLDIESGMVEIEATIIDINTDKTRELGVNWRYQQSDGDVLFGAGTSADQSLIVGNGPITTQGQGGILSFSLGEPANFLARVRLLEERGAAKVISKPHVITLSDVEAVLAATTEFYVRVAGREEVDLFNIPVGTTLRVTPHIFTDNNQRKIKLLVNIEDGSQSAGVAVDNIPVVERANISTQAVINEGDSLLVGGLVRESYKNTGYQVPVLGRIPLIGGLFRSKQKKATRVERLFMITPRIAAGIGFDGTNKYSALSGNESRIVQDAANRISSSKYAERNEINYWSKVSRAEKVRYNVAPSKTAAAITPSSTDSSAFIPNSLSQAPGSKTEGSTNYIAGDPVYAVIENNVFMTPFEVKQWSIDN